ncbi:MAG: OmpA family protein [Proteobacteria bacterium]|nr:OmpA family protein [Pseudomonadota bacterium]
MSLRPIQPESAAPDPNPLQDATWLYSYADLVTQLLLFTILSVTVIGIRDLAIEEHVEKIDGTQNELDNTAHLLNEFVKDQQLGDTVSIDRSAGRVAIRLKSHLLFRKGSAYLEPRARRVLDGISNLLHRIKRNLRIEGHTDNVPIRNSKMASNWELSTARAISVVQYLEKTGVDRNRISAAGYGEYHPIIVNDSDEHRSMNRRVEIVVLGN